MRQTLVIVITSCDEALMRLAGSVARYSWRGVRTVMVVASDSVNDEARALMERAALLLGIEQSFHWPLPETQAGAQRLARTLRSFQPQVVLTTPAALNLCQAGWAIAADSAVSMPGLPLFDGKSSQLWEPGEGAARIPVPLTAGIRHALSCLFAREPFTMTERRRALEREWAATERFALVAGAPCPTVIEDFFTSDIQGNP